VRLFIVGFGLALGFVVCVILARVAPWWSLVLLVYALGVTCGVGYETLKEES
jgi:hypothetical protein